ncbi:MAG TPA: sodium/solute symporter [Verrucomicrobia bacterium]|nr:sodium/solute symporter [Verrucomicrobiota bacterium]HOP98565.1 sodium/solute symporter [Verrucomicrobiota bacterium]
MHDNLQISGIDAAIVCVYFAVVFGIGVYFSRHQKTTQDYFLAGRRVPGWVVIFAIVGTMISSTSFVGHSGNVFATNLWALPQFLMLPVVMVFVSRFVVTFYRRTVRMSIYDYLEKRFSYPARAYGAAAFIVSRVVDMSATLYFLAIPVSFMTGIHMGWVIVIVGVVTLVMTVAGGIAAVVYADVLQGALLVGGALACLGIALFRPEGGPGAVLSTAWDGGKFALGDWSFSWVTDNVWVFLVGGAIWAVQRYALDQHIVQKYLVAKTDRDARKSAYFGALACLPVWGLFFLLGACLWAFFQLTGAELPGDVARVKDNIVPYFIKTQLPVGAIGLVIAALAAAAMSSLDSDLNSMATVIVDDYYSRLRPRASDREQLMVGRVAVALLGVSAIVFSLSWIGIGTAMEFGVQLFSIATAGMLGLFALGALTKRATARGALIGIIACILFTGWATFTSVKLPALDRVLVDLGPFNYGLNPYLIGVFNHAIVFGVGLAASVLFDRKVARANASLKAVVNS